MNKLQVFEFTFDATTIIVMADSLSRAISLAQEHDNNIYLDKETLHIFYKWPGFNERLRVCQYMTEGVKFSVSH